MVYYMEYKDWKCTKILEVLVKYEVKKDKAFGDHGILCNSNISRAANYLP